MALAPTTQFEFRANGTLNGGGGFVWFSLVNSTYKWTESGSGTNEYYVELNAGGDPSFVEALSVQLDSFFNLAVNGTLGSLNVSEWDWGDNDSLGFSTVYVRLAANAANVDPDLQGADDFVSMGDAGGKDYSQQDAVHAARTDLVIGSAGNEDELSSAADPFASDDINNTVTIKNSVSGFTNDRYRVLSVSGGVATMDRNVGTADSTSGVGDLGGAMTFIDVNTEDLEPGIFNHVKKDGTHIGTVAQAKDGLADLRITYQGFNLLRGDLTTESPRGDMPLCANGASTFQFDNFINFRHFRVSGSSVDAIRMDNNASIYNVKALNFSTTADRTGIGLIAGGGKVNWCEAQSFAGRAISIRQATDVMDCYVHDSVVGIFSSNFDEIRAMRNLVERNDIGILFEGTQANSSLFNNTLHLNGVGIDLNNGTNHRIYRNILANTVGVAITFDVTNQTNNGNDNNYFNNGTDTNNFLKGPNDIALDPEFVAPDGVIHTDLVSDGAAPSVVSSVAQPFVENRDEGLAFELVDGITDFTDDFYSVDTIDGSGNATLNDSQDTGANATGGHFRLAESKDYNVGPNMSIDIQHPSTGSVYHLTIGAFPRAAGAGGAASILGAGDLRGGFL